MSATANNFAVTVSSVGSSYIQLDGSVSSGTLTFGTSVSGCGGCTPPGHGTLSDFNVSTGVLTYTPDSGFTGSDTFEFVAIQDGSTTSSEGTCTITVTSAKTAVQDYILNPDGSSRGGTVTFILTQQATSGEGLIPASSTVSATVNAGTGLFSASLYPSSGLSPQSYYQMWWGSTDNLRRELLGVYDIPASASTIQLAPYKVTDTNLAARYTFVSKAGFQAFNARSFAVQVLNGGSAVGTRGAINFIAGSNISYTIADNSGAGRIDVTINGPAGGGTGGSVNSGAAGKLAYYATTGTTVGGLAFGTANQVLGMNNGATAHEYKTITAGTGIGVTHGANAITIANTGVASINGSSVGAQVIQIGTSACGSAPGVSSASGTTTICIPLASTTAGGYVNVGTQSFAGAKTFYGDGLSDVPLAVRQIASGSTTLQQWYNNTPGEIAAMATTGLYALALAAGNNTSISATAVTPLTIQHGYGATSQAEPVGIYTAITSDGTEVNYAYAATTNYLTLNGSATHLSAALAGGRFQFQNNSSAAATGRGAGVRSTVVNSNTGQINNLHGYYATASQSNGTIVNLSHFYAAAHSVTGGTTTNQYGLYIESLSAATNNWGIYAAGTMGSSIGGFFDLRGRTAPSASSSGEARIYADASGLLALSQGGGTYSWLQGVPVIAKTSNYSIVARDIKTRFTNAAASGTVVFTLPAASAGMVFAFYVLAAQTLTITAGTGATIRNAASASSSAGTASANTVGNVIVLTAVSATSWITESVIGTWTLA